jgi:hypothetical protein
LSFPLTNAGKTQRASVVVEKTDVVIALLFLYNAFQPHAFFLLRACLSRKNALLFGFHSSALEMSSKGRIYHIMSQCVLDYVGEYHAVDLHV